MHFHYNIYIVSCKILCRYIIFPASFILLKLRYTFFYSPPSKLPPALHNDHEISLHCFLPYDEVILFYYTDFLYIFRDCIQTMYKPIIPMYFVYSFSMCSCFGFVYILFTVLFLLTIHSTWHLQSEEEESYYIIEWPTHLIVYILHALNTNIIDYVFEIIIIPCVLLISYL